VIRTSHSVYINQKKRPQHEFERGWLGLGTGVKSKFTAIQSLCCLSYSVTNIVDVPILDTYNKYKWIYFHLSEVSPECTVIKIKALSILIYNPASYSVCSVESGYCLLPHRYEEWVQITLG
jgi:hypothetical protein